MRFDYRLALLLFVLSTGANGVQGQTLTQELIQEAPETLVLQAREKGNIVRGAILFHQGNINCAKCHRPAADKDRLAPELSRLGKEVTDASIVESILQPSKAITKGFETLSVLTVDGHVISGLAVTQNDTSVVLRNGQDIDILVSIPREGIDEIVPSNVSIMPNGLVDQLTSRQQFLDLLRYVINIKERGPTSASDLGESAPIRELTAEVNGRVLIRQRNCAACHESSSIESLPAANRAPILKWSAQRLNPQHLIQFIANPHSLKPGTSMPAMMGHLNESERNAAAEAIVHFLVSVNGNEFRRSSSSPNADAIPRGREIFHTVGCVACHSPPDERATEQWLDDSVGMGNLANKYDSESLVAFLMDPHAVRPSGRMPNMQLTRREALDLSDYLLQPREGSDFATAEPWKVEAELAKLGERLFEEFNCVKCHSGVVEPPRTPPSFATLAEVDTDKGCLSSSHGNWPDFALTKAETADIKAALNSGLSELDASQTIDFTLASYRCFACHSRNNLGGVSPQRQLHFQTTNLNLGEQGRIPPTLTGVGAKLNPAWMRDVLVNRRSIRPYMKTRMPQYGEQNVGHLVNLFQSIDKLPETRFATFKDQQETRKIGLKIAGEDGLNCAACHTFQYKLSDTMPAVDLTEMAERLKKDWFYQYMLAPQHFSPNTVMPSYWPNGVALRSDIAGTPEDQVEALWQYLLDGRQASPPAGVIKEPLEIVVTHEARMLRRKYSEIGKRGIGVGYPGGVNLVYDAQQMRLATIWKGKFVDPAAVWYGQGHGDVRPLGPTIQLAKGPELFEQSKPWNVEERRPPGHQFKGYSLDQQRRPTLRYEFGSIAVEDYFSEFKDDTTGQIQLRRHIKLTSTEERDQLWFRLASSDEIETESSGSYRIGKRLRIRVASGQQVEVADKGLLYLPLKFDAPQTQEIVIEYLWE